MTADRASGQDERTAGLPALERRVLLLAPTPRDAELCAAVLGEAGFDCRVCNSVEELCREEQRGAGAVLLAESALPAGGLEQVAQLVRRQPAWSDLPILLLTRGGATDSPFAPAIRQALGNPNLLEMPVRASTLQSAVRTALRSRARQYEIRDQLVAQQRAEQAVESERVFLRQVIDTTPSLVFVKDWEGRFVLANDALARAYGTTAEMIVGRTDGDFNANSEEVAHFLRDDREVIRTRLPKLIDEEEVTLATGEVRWFRTIKVPLEDPDGTCNKVLGIATDITVRRQAAEELREANRRLAEADHQKDEFLAMLAHELRNPLAPVRNAVHILHLVGADAQARERQRQIIDRQVAHMARLLDDLLEVSRITRGKITLQQQRVELDTVLASAVETANPLIESRHHTLSCSTSAERLEVQGDADRLIQLVGNLLTNAAKFTPDGGSIWLEAAREAGQVVVRVRDSGIGIAPEMLPRVFDIFVQAERGLERTQGGLGLGLTLVRRLVEMHGGSVEARSAGRGRGSEFIVRLPALPEQTPEAPRDAGDQVASPQKRLRVLVVDDVLDSVRSLAEVLDLWGHDVRFATDGEGALQAAREFHPALVLLDIGMPGMNGFETARRLRAEHGTDTMMLVALSGYGQEEDRRRAKEAGFDRHLVKPADLGAISELLAEIPATPE